ncbi:e3 mib2 ubiquitin-protein ligase, partial [Mytilus galloprovincialis]
MQYDDDFIAKSVVRSRYERGDVLVEWDHGLACFYDYDDEPEEQNIVKVNEVRMLVGEPMAVGCRVVRGQDWKYANTDGGRGTYGTVLCILEEGKVVVRWDNKNVGIYRMGYEGLFEIKLSNSNALQNEETQKYNKTQQRLKKREIMKHHNDSSTIKSNDCDTDDYLIPIYSDVAEEVA